MKINSKKLEKSVLDLELELDEQEFQKYWEKALVHLKGHVKMDGFRNGHAPLEMVEKKAGSENVLMEAGDLAVKETYTRYINENNIEPIGNPEVQIKKIAKGSPFVFTVKVSLLPDIDLPDYKKIAASLKPKNLDVDEKELQDALVYLQKSRAKFSPLDRAAEWKDYLEIEYTNPNINKGKMVKDRFVLGESGFMKDFEENLVGMKAGEEKKFAAKFPEGAPKEVAGKESEFSVKVNSVQNIELPEINDEFAKSLGMFETLTALKDNLKEGIGLEKKEGERQKNRTEILAAIAKDIKFELPATMVEHERQRSLHDFKHQVTQQFNMPFEDYLKSVKKTEEDIVKSMTEEAERRIKHFLVLRQVGKAENIEITKEEMQDEMNKFIKNYSKEEADKIDINQLKEYTKTAIYNEKVFQKLESF